MTAPRSLWHLTAPPIRGDEVLPERVDVVVAGGGLAGVGAALEVARGGRSVVLVEAEELGGRTTSRTTGKLTLLQGATYQQLHDHAGAAAVRAYALANRTARDWLLGEVSDVPGAVTERPSYTYALTATGVRTIAREEAAMRAAGLEVTRRAKGEIGLPFDADAALELPGQHQLHPLLMMTELVERLRAVGGVALQRCRVQRVSADAREVVVHTTRGTIRAGHLVLATGTPILDRSLLFASLEPERQFVAAYRLTGPPAPPAGMYLSVDLFSRSMRTARDEEGRTVVLMGGEDHVTGRDPDTRSRLERLDAWAQWVYPSSVRHTWWAAQDYRHTTRMPFAGPVRGGHGRIFAMTGFAKWGMTNAVAAALAVAGTLRADPPAWTEAFRGSVGLRDIGATAGLNAGVAGHMIGGWSRAVTGDRAPDAQAEVHRRGLRPVAESRIDGRHCAVSAVCPHLGGIVRWNSAERTWDCPLHGSRFAPDGRVLEGPAVHDLAPVAVRGDRADTERKEPA